MEILNNYKNKKNDKSSLLFKDYVNGIENSEKIEFYNSAKSKILNEISALISSTDEELTDILLTASVNCFEKINIELNNTLNIFNESTILSENEKTVLLALLQRFIMLETVNHTN